MDKFYATDGRDNNLVGGNGNDILEGGQGRDTIIGGNGDDRLTGDVCPLLQIERDRP